MTSIVDESYRDSMQRLIADRWRTVWTALPVAMDGTDIEGVHDVRVASRRLRAAMDVAVDAFPEPAFRKLHRAAKEITSALGDVRDRDVLLEKLRADQADVTASERAAYQRLIDRIEAERVVAREQMLSFLNELLERDVLEQTAKFFGEAARPEWHTETKPLA